LVDGEILNSDDDNDNLPSVKQILAFLKRVKRAKQIINFTDDDNDDREDNDSDFTKVSWLKTTLTARYFLRLISPSLINRI
jgi:hypothetical protein